MQWFPWHQDDDCENQSLLKTLGIYFFPQSGMPSSHDPSKAILPIFTVPSYSIYSSVPLNPRVYCKRELTWRQREKKRDRVKTDAKCIPDGSLENGSATTESIIVLFFFSVVDADPLHICWKAFTQWDMVIDSPSISSSVRAGILLSW